MHPLPDFYEYVPLCVCVCVCLCVRVVKYGYQGSAGLMSAALLHTLTLTTPVQFSSRVRVVKETPLPPV